MPINNSCPVSNNPLTRIFNEPAPRHIGPLVLASPGGLSEAQAKKMEAELTFPNQLVAKLATNRGYWVNQGNFVSTSENGVPYLIVSSRNQTSFALIKTPYGDPQIIATETCTTVDRFKKKHGLTGPTEMDYRNGKWRFPAR
ncbi:hypothetical protein [Noviherbaspirillum humi]|uniref:hypothetical protein n=1 Tax=Noviherbaspirillum humi TaxID=1688639 RepID=UPI0011600F1F|nr:hypothetical protein [Noviherbaspirillum humi]